MESVSPVFGKEELPFERIIARNQPEYAPIVALQIDLSRPDPEHEGQIITKPRYAMAVRFRFTEEERIAIIKGADLVITELVFGGPFTPINLQFCKPEEKPEIQL